MSFKEKVFGKLLSKSDRYNFYKNAYEEHKKEKANYLLYRNPKKCYC